MWNQIKNIIIDNKYLFLGLLIASPFILNYTYKEYYKASSRMVISISDYKCGINDQNKGFEVSGYIDSVREECEDYCPVRVRGSLDRQSAYIDVFFPLSDGIRANSMTTEDSWLPFDDNAEPIKSKEKYYLEGTIDFSTASAECLLKVDKLSLEREVR